jgi:PAS domain S-box-containing protein
MPYSPLYVLLLEDSHDDAQLLVHELRRAGFDVTSERVQTEREFKERLGAGHDVILADFRLPDFDALRALKIVRERALDVPFIVVTGALADEGTVECFKAGAVDCLLKDRLARLGQAVAQAIEQKRSRDEHRRAEAALRDSEARKAAILDMAPDAILTIDESGCVESLNPAAERLFGYRAAAVVGNSIVTLLPRPPSSPVAGETTIDNPIALDCGGRPGREAIGKKSDGTTFPLELSTSETQLGERRICTAIVRDISQRKAAERELSVRMHELARSNVELEQFAYVASHDLKEPLRAVSSFTDLLARRYADRLDATAREFISYITAGAAQMHRLIDDLMAYSRTGTQRVVQEITDGATLVERALMALKPATEETAAVVSYDPLPTVVGDPHQLIRVFENLIGNAIKYHSHESPRVHISAQRSGEDWVFCVRDNGIGFAPKHAERIFVMFQRLHTRDEYPGTGIGLAICKKIVERHGGRIWAESEPGRGSRFFFTVAAATRVEGERCARKEAELRGREPGDTRASRVS